MGNEFSAFLQTKEAVTIDEVIAQMELLVAACIKTNDRLGYFTALYYKVTVSVKEGIQNNEFEDGQRMEKLDVLFANRFLTAVKQWKSNTQPTGPWEIAFKAANKSTVLVLQHLLLGMNAHINLDLGIAAARVSAGTDIKNIRNDFKVDKKNHDTKECSLHSGILNLQEKEHFSYSYVRTEM